MPILELTLMRLIRFSVAEPASARNPPVALSVADCIWGEDIALDALWAGDNSIVAAVSQVIWPLILIPFSFEFLPFILILRQ